MRNAARPLHFSVSLATQHCVAINRRNLRQKAAEKLLTGGANSGEYCLLAALGESTENSNRVRHGKLTAQSTKLAITHLA
jgi:hypothetical protein